jgi:hypothetical protein
MFGAEHFERVIANLVRACDNLQGFGDADAIDGRRIREEK